MMECITIVREHVSLTFEHIKNINAQRFKGLACQVMIKSYQVKTHPQIRQQYIRDTVVYVSKGTGKWSFVAGHIYK